MNKGRKKRISDCHNTARGSIKVTMEALRPHKVQIVPNATANLKLLLDHISEAASAPNNSPRNEKAVSSWS